MYGPTDVKKNHHMYLPYTTLHTLQIIVTSNIFIVIQNFTVLFNSEF